jgi:hypothetical protein
MNCTDFKFPMSLDFYYATETQDKYGIEDKNWQWDQTLQGYAEILGSVDKEALKTGKFNEYEDKLIGRTKVDPRLSINGIYYPITSILVTNIRNTKNGQEYYIEAAGDREGKSTVYEIFAIEPYVNPWNEIEYWKILFNRSDTQALDEL